MISRRDLLTGGGVLVPSALAGLGLTRAGLAHANPDREIDAVMLVGFDEPGDQGRGAIYRLGSSSGPMAMKDSGGRWWELAAGDDIWAGWFGVLGKGDDTEAFQRAFDYLDARGTGGVLRIAAGTYQVARRGGLVPIGAGDDGRPPRPDVEQIAPELSRSQAYCLRIPNRVSIVGEGEVVIAGSYKYGNASLSELICMVAPDVDLITVRISNVTFQRYFMGFACVMRRPLADCIFERLRFSDCAIGVYGQNLERCRFEDIIAYGTACVIAVGGQWATRDDTFHEGGGFADKCIFNALHNNFGRGLAQAEAQIDHYFDSYFFRTRNNETRLVSASDTPSIGRMFPYLGVSGRAIYIMARHGRPSNANKFGLVSHAYAPRAAIWLDNAIACSGDIVYLERCGYIDPGGSSGAIGIAAIDPFLGRGQRVPAFVRGFDCTVDAQEVVSETLVLDGAMADKWIYASKIERPQTRQVFAEEITTPRLVATGPNQQLGDMNIGSVLVPAGGLVETSLSVRAGAGGVLLLVTGGGADCPSSLYFVGIVGNVAQAHLMAGPDTLDASISPSGKLQLSSRHASPRSALIFGAAVASLTH